VQAGSAVPDLYQGQGESAAIPFFFGSPWSERIALTRYLNVRGKERGINTKVRVKLADKMPMIAWTMMKNETVFSRNLWRRGKRNADNRLFETV
jgi:hypothetical protein